jgi:regulator of sirC expression with transglutaminase-like and TPR domain
MEGKVGHHAFDLLMELPAEHIRLDCAALHLARDVFPQITLERYLRQLDELAEQVAALRPGPGAARRYEAVRAILVEEHGFTGRGADYSDPRDCYLNCVLERRTGLPVTLCVVWLEVARRLKWPAAGVALPGHFLVRFDDPERLVLADPFADGAPVSIGDCRRLLADRFGSAIDFSFAMLTPADSRIVLMRMLNNLRRIYLERCDWPRLSTVLRRLLAVEPESGEHLQELASVCARRGDVRGAYTFLRLYLKRVPRAADCDLVQSNLARLEAALAARN